jgi:protein-tyrosine kinase
MSIIEKAADRLAQNRVEGISPNINPANRQPEFNSLNKSVDEHLKTSSLNEYAKRVEINLEKLNQLGMVTPTHDRTLASQEFSGIKRALIQNTVTNRNSSNIHSNLIMLTSSFPGEGKTFCAINLAMSLAMEMDHTVLLVDADVARPSLLRTLGLEAELGLMDVLLDEKLDLADVLLKTNIETLSILPAGKSHRHSTELLASMAMHKLLNELSNRYADRIIIFDSPPLLLTNEAHVLANQMGQVVLVVAAEKTTQRAVRNSLQLLESKAQVSLIYNKAEPFLSEDKYGYAYGYNS